MATVSDRGSETILLVEDEDEVRAVLHQILVGKGYRVLQAASGEEALAISRLHRGPIHLLLTDVTMPEMKGPELAARLRAERPQTRVVFMSGYNDELLSGRRGRPALPPEAVLRRRRWARPCAPSSTPPRSCAPPADQGSQSGARASACLEARQWQRQTEHRLR